MNEQAINSIKDALREMMQILVQRGEPLSEELKTKLAQVIEHAANRITKLREEGSEDLEIESIEKEQEKVAEELTGKQEAKIPTGGPIPDLEPVPHESSNINAVKYDPKTKELFVKFNGKDQKDSGPVYSYQGVNNNIFNVIIRGGVAPLTSGKNKYHQWFKGITPSHGASVNALLVKGQYPYQRVS